VISNLDAIIELAEILVIMLILSLHLSLSFLFFFRRTHVYRIFPINRTLKELLEELPQKSDYVFLNYEGEPISQHALNRIWQGLLPKLGIRYRIPYQLRRSMISYHANRGFPITQLANLVGNSEKVIKDCYLKIDVSLINVPTIE
jgi:integrase